MIFAAPIAGLIAGLLGAAVVVLLYMLKLRRRPVTVSSTMLWRRAVRDMEGNVPWQAARPSVLMLLHLLIVALIAIAIARPSIGSMLSDQRVVIVIDTSASMNARVRADGVTRFELARGQAADRVRSLVRSAGSPEITVYRVGASARLVAGPTRDVKQVLRAIDAIEPTDEPGDLTRAFEQIRATRPGLVIGGGLVEESEAAGRVDPGSTRVLVFTDGGAGGIPPTIDGASVGVIVPGGEPRGNVGIVALSAERDRATPELCRVFVRVQSTERGPTGLILRALESGSELARAAVAFDASGGGAASRVTTLEFPLDHGAELEVVIDHDDALDTDNRAWVRVPDPSPVRVVVVAAGSAHPILLDVLGVIAGREPAVIGAGDPLPAWVELVVYDGVPESGSRLIPSVCFGPSGEWGPVERVVSWKRSHPVLRDVAMGLIAFDSPGGLADENVLASSDQSVVMTEHAGGGVRRLRVAFDLDRSNWPVQVGFTIFLANAVEYLVPGASGVGTVTRTDELHPLVGIHETRAPGGTEPVGVSLLDEHESLAGMSTEQRGEARGGQIGGGLTGGDRPVWRWFVLAALVLMSIEWVLHASRVRV